MGCDRMEVRPSRSFADAVGPAAAPVTKALAPDLTVPSCFGPALVVEEGFARAKRALAGAVSVPSGSPTQPRDTSRSSSKAPQRAARTAAPRTASGQDARSMR